MTRNKGVLLSAIVVSMLAVSACASQQDFDQLRQDVTDAKAAAESAAMSAQNSAEQARMAADRADQAAASAAMASEKADRIYQQSLRK